MSEPEAGRRVNRFCAFCASAAAGNVCRKIKEEKLEEELEKRIKRVANEHDTDGIDDGRLGPF